MLGFVEDLDSLLNRCRISVAPLRFGAGIKGKVATALQAGLPTVATPIAVEGTPLLHDFEILIANKPEDFAEQVVRLYLDNVLWERLSIAGFAFVQREYSFDANRQRLRTLLTDIDMQPPIDEI